MKRKKEFLIHLENAEKIVVMTPQKAKVELKNICGEITSANLDYSGWYGAKVIDKNEVTTRTLYVTPENAHLANIELDEKAISDAMAITQEDFWNLTQVKAAQYIQKRNRFGSDLHRKAHEVICKLSVKYGVQQFFGTMAEYDEDVKIMHQGV